MIAKHIFGRTGHESTRVLFGAAALGSVTQAEADHTMELIMQHGINHIDTAASYGESEDRLGPWMAKYRNQFFLATKTGERTYQAARDQFHKSLERLQVDSVDLIQMHFLVDPHEWDIAMGPGGALEALIEARQQGLVKYIGVTGHEVTVAKMHLKSLERFDFDSVLLPYNYPMMQNAQYAADFEQLVAVCQARNVAIQAIKSITLGAWGDKTRTAATWYEPLREQPEIDTAVHWVLGRDGFFLNSVGDISILPMQLDAASRYQVRPSNEVMDALVAQRSMTPLFV